VSYVPWIWHPLIHVTDPGSVDYFSTDMDIRPRDVLSGGKARPKPAGPRFAEGYRVNPGLSARAAQVARAFYTAFTTPPRLQDEPWLHQSLGHSIRTIFSGYFFVHSRSAIGILCGTYRFFAKLQEPFVEFFRYLPAPAFGALCVAILGIEDARKSPSFSSAHFPTNFNHRQQRSQS